MINNKLYLETLLQTLQHNDLKNVLAAPFRNKHFDFYPVPIPLREECVQDYVTNLNSYIALLDKVIALYKTESGIRNYFNFSEAVNELVLLSIEKEQGKFFSRFDGYLTTQNQIKILENNSDAPAGTIFTPRINNMCINFLNRLGSHNGGLSKYTMMNDRIMVDVMVEEYLRLFQKRPNNLAVFQIRGKANNESVELSKFSDEELEIFVVDPRDIQYEQDGVYANGRKIDLVWNKINTVYWNQLVETDPWLISKWTEVITKASNFIHFNPFSKRYITENKLFAALLYHENFSSFFTEEERRIRDLFVPQSYKLEKGKTIAFKGQQFDLYDFAVNFRTELVLKETYDIRGDGVTIGIASSGIHWEERLKAAFDKGGILQYYIQPKQLYFFKDFDNIDLTNMNFHVDTFIFGSQILGFGGKASANHKVNIFQGGVKAPVLVFKS